MKANWNYDKRKGRRQALSHRAEIARIEDGERLADCLVLDISASGARLGLSSVADIPKEFVLVLSKPGRVLRRCKVVRSAANEIGVTFVGPSRK